MQQTTVATKAVTNSIRSDLRTDKLVLGFETFYVGGPEIERSVVTGRLGADVLKGEGFDDFDPRWGWRAVFN